MTEYETRWNDSRRYFWSKAAAIAFAKQCDESVRVLHWGNGAIVWSAYPLKPIESLARG